MNFGLSTYLYSQERLNSHILDNVRNAGFERLEIFASRDHLDYHDRNHIRDVAQWFSDHAVELHSVHAPHYSSAAAGHDRDFPISPAYVEKRRRIDSMDEVKRALEIAEVLPFKFLVLHLGLEGEEFDLRKFDAAFTSFEHLKLFAKERNVKILLENNIGPLGNPGRIHEFIRYTRLDLKVCIDVGHAFLTGELCPAIQKLASMAGSVHLHDNQGERDDHLMPFDGKIAWQEAMRSLRDVEADAPLFLELRHPARGAFRLESARPVIEKLHELGAVDKHE
jgi:sugar phosphate isomerase/epimerase